MQKVVFADVLVQRKGKPSKVYKAQVVGNTIRFAYNDEPSRFVKKRMRIINTYDGTPEWATSAMRWILANSV